MTESVVPSKASVTVWSAPPARVGAIGPWNVSCFVSASVVPWTVAVTFTTPGVVFVIVTLQKPSGPVRHVAALRTAPPSAVMSSGARSTGTAAVPMRSCVTEISIVAASGRFVPAVVGVIVTATIAGVPAT